jgi:hypothetical protein
VVSRLARYLSLGSPWSSGLSCPENPRVGGSIPSQATKLHAFDPLTLHHPCISGS